MSSLSALRRMSTRQLDEVIEKATALKHGKQQEEKLEARREIEGMLKERGFALKDILKARVYRPAKYSNPKDSTQTWAGRGRPPKWFKKETALSA